MTPAPLLTKRQLADRLQVSTRTIDRHIKAGLLPSRLAGSRRRFDPAEVDAYLVRHRQPTSR